MNGRSHPARRARVMVGAAGSAGFVLMVGTISQASTVVLAADLSSQLVPSTDLPELDLQGSAVPGPAAQSGIGNDPDDTDSPETTDSPEMTEQQPGTTVAATPVTTSASADTTSDGS